MNENRREEQIEKYRVQAINSGWWQSSSRSAGLEALNTWTEMSFLPVYTHTSFTTAGKGGRTKIYCMFHGILHYEALWWLLHTQSSQQHHFMHFTDHKTRMSVSRRATLHHRHAHKCPWTWFIVCLRNPALTCRWRCDWPCWKYLQQWQHRHDVTTNYWARCLLPTGTCLCVCVHGLTSVWSAAASSSSSRLIALIEGFWPDWYAGTESIWQCSVWPAIFCCCRGFDRFPGNQVLWKWLLWMFITFLSQGAPVAQIYWCCFC